MIARIPDEELAARKAEREKLSALFENLDVASQVQSPDETEGGNHA